MFKNYLRTAFRHLLRHKLFSGLNIFGLATGMACSILIFLWVKDELSFDQFNPHADQIFRVVEEGGEESYAVSPPALANAAKTQIAAIQHATRVRRIQKMITVGTKKFDEKNIFYADSNFLRIFNYPLIRGHLQNVLSSPNSVVLTEAMAKKYFGGADAAMNKTIHIDNDIKGSDLLVTGVLKNIPSNSHLQPDMLVPMEQYDRINNPIYGWTNFDVHVYFQLKTSVAPTQANMAMVTKKINDIYQQNNKEFPVTLAAQPLTDIHLRSHYKLDVDNNGHDAYVRIFALAAVFIILIACINFMNLATAVSGERAKEVGLRKTIGAVRFQLIAQFIGESLLLSFISLVLAVLMVYLLLPLFNQVASKSISFNPFHPAIFFALIGITLLTGIFSGSYPAFFLSSFNAIKALKGKNILRSNKSFLRNGLVVLQFSISVILMVSTLVIHNQLNYIQNRDIGFDKENLLYMSMPQVGDLKNNKDAMIATLASYPDIRAYSFTDELPTNLTNSSLLTWRGMPPAKQVLACRLQVDENFTKTFGMQLLAGRFFSKDFGNNDSAYVVNEAALKAMGLTINNAIGKVISIALEDRPAPIIGVLKDFNFQPVQQAIGPLVMKTNFGGGFVVMRTSPATIQKVTASLQRIFHSVYGDFPFSYGFVNEDLNKLYLAEQSMQKLFNVFSILSIVISCLGLFGLASFAARQRIKEVGIRKVLGAGAAGIVALLSKDFIRLVFLSLLIAFPAAWWAMNKWLQGFAYRISIGWWVFALAGVLALCIAMVTVSFQSIRAALANPVRSLKTE